MQLQIAAKPPVLCCHLVNTNDPDDSASSRLVVHGVGVGFRYHLKDVIVGKIYFLLVRIKIQHMELQIIKRETTGSGKLGIVSSSACCVMQCSV